MPEPQKELEKALTQVAEINRFTLKVFKAQSRQTLIFMILNDTAKIVKYDRTVLWKIRKGGMPELLGVSGQPSINKHADLSRKWQTIIKQLKNPEKPQTIKHPELPPTSSIVWLPIFSYDKLALGLWVERWEAPWKKEDLDILQFLAQSFGAAWEKFSHKFDIRSLSKRPFLIGALVLFIAIFVIKVPLRVVAPCEIVPKNPVVIAAPLEGIIDKIDVLPGQEIKAGDLLAEYDKRVPIENLRVEEKKVEIMKAELDRAIAQAQNDKKALAELTVEELKLKKEQLDLELYEFQATQLEIKSPVNGVTMFDSPEDWRGKPVKVGEKIMMIANPDNTKIRMWIPEDDNIVLDYNKPITVFLNPNPERGISAKLIYIASYTHMSEKGVPSFIAEADWSGNTSDIKLGLKGSAILYGEDVTIFYWLIRKPLVFLRRFFAI